MSIETEKKYRLDADSKSEVVEALKEMGAEYVRRDFEENVIYSSPHLRQINGAVRLRHVGDRTVLTLKRRVPNDAGVKQQVEHETELADAESMRAILNELGIEPVLVYEKHRDTWRFRSVEVVLDELPYGSFMEIEGTITGIKEAEILLGIEHLEVVPETYPTLTSRLGKKIGDLIEARFEKTDDDA
jgi:adenylate cyclase, class 2